MSQNACAPNSVPNWIASGIVGVALGAGGMFVGLQNHQAGRDSVDLPAAGAATGGQKLPSPPMGASAMGMGAMGGMGGGMGGAAGKRNLTSLVGKLELLSRPDLKLHVDLSADQVQGIAAKLDQLDKAEKMTAEEAQTHLDDLETLLTEDQKTTLGLVGLPMNRGGGGGGSRPGGGGGGPPAAAAIPVMGGPPGGGGGPAPDDNPFAQETSQKRLRDLLGRLNPPSSTTEKPAGEGAPRPTE